MSEAHKGENAPKPKGTPGQFTCEWCKHAIEKADDCIELPLSTAYPAAFMHHVAGGNPVRFHSGCWESSQVRERVDADRQKHRRECEACGAEPENEFTSAEQSKEAPEPENTISEDARGLGPTYAGRFVIGHVDEIVGEGGAKVPGFVATKNEVVQLVRYWATEIIDLDFSFFLYGSSGSSEWRTREFASRRLNTISNIVGKELVEKAVRRAEQAFGNKVDPRAWKIFTEGTQEERERFAREVDERLGDDAEDVGKHPGLSYSQETLKRAFCSFPCLRCATSRVAGEKFRVFRC